MSNPTPPATPDPAQIQQAIDKAATPSTSGAMPLEVHLETGQVYRGQTPQELLDQMVQAQTHASRTISQQREELESMKQRVKTLETPKPSADEAAKQAKLNEYYQLWAQNPNEALKHQLAEVLDVPPDKAIEVLKGAVAKTTTNSASDEFMARFPDYPNTPQTAQMMRQRLAERFGDNLHSVTADNLELAYNSLVREGRITPQYVAPSSIANPNQVIPSLRGSSAPPNPVNDIMARFQGMTLDQMKQTLDELSRNIR